jgi:hypothetical protein
MKIAAWLALCIVVCVKPAMAENAANAHLLSLAPEARTLASPIHHGMSAFAVAIGGKADMPFCAANVRL